MAYKDPLHIDPRHLLNRDYRWVAYSVDKSDSFRMNLDDYPALSIEVKAYIEKLQNFKDSIIKNGFTPVSGEAITFEINLSWIDDDNDHVKYGGLILCSRPRVTSMESDINTADQLKTVMDNLNSTLAEMLKKENDNG